MLHRDFRPANSAEPMQQACRSHAFFTAALKESASPGVSSPAIRITTRPSFMTVGFKVAAETLQLIWTAIIAAKIAPAHSLIDVSAHCSPVQILPQRSSEGNWKCLSVSENGGRLTKSTEHSGGCDNPDRRYAAFTELCA
jgi:hypothetical protein